MGQIEGGFIQGMGWLTMEELWWNDKGKLMTHAPSTYKIPVANDVPPVFNVKIWESGINAEDSIYRSKAVGEPPLMLAISVHQAIKDAVASVADYRASPRLDTPATPEEILHSVEELQARARARPRARGRSRRGGRRHDATGSTRSSRAARARRARGAGERRVDERLRAARSRARGWSSPRTRSTARSAAAISNSRRSASRATCSLRRARRAAELRRFPLGASLGQCCGGLVNLLFEPVDADADWVDALASLRRERRCRGRGDAGGARDRWPPDRDAPTTRIGSLGDAGARCARRGRGARAARGRRRRAARASSMRVPANAGRAGLPRSAARRRFRHRAVRRRARRPCAGRACSRRIACRVTWVDERESEFPAERSRQRQRRRHGHAGSGGRRRVGRRVFPGDDAQPPARPGARRSDPAARRFRLLRPDRIAVEAAAIRAPDGGAGNSGGALRRHDVPDRRAGDHGQGAGDDRDRRRGAAAAGARNGRRDARSTCAAAAKQG